MRTVRIPDGVTSIGEEAFVGCMSLVEVDLPESVVEIGRGAFRGCLRLERVRVRGAVERSMVLK